MFRLYRYIGMGLQYNGNTDDGSCEYAQEYYDCNGLCLSDLDNDGYCDELDNCPDV